MVVRGSGRRWHRAQRAWLGLAGTAIALLVLGCPHASAATGSNPASGSTDRLCSDPILAGATINSTLVVTTQGVDEPLITSTTEITVPESWSGSDALLAAGRRQGVSLACFMPIDQFDYQATGPAVSVQAAAKGKPAQVDVRDSVAVTDWADTAASWPQGLWQLTRNRDGYAVVFAPRAAGFLRYPSWTVTLSAPGVTVLGPSREPTRDDGRGTLDWSLPASPQAPPQISATLSGPWQVRMNIAADNWPSRPFFDFSWTVGDGLLVDGIALLACWRVWRRPRDDGERRVLPAALGLVALLSIAGYVWNIIDNANWINQNGTVLVFSENAVLLVGASIFFISALLPRGRPWRRAAVLVLAVVDTICLSFKFSIWPTIPAGGLDWGNLFVEMAPLLLAVTLANVGLVLWISFLWASGKGRQAGRAPSSGPPLGGTKRLVAAIAGAIGLSVLVLAESAASSYYYWVHSDWWRQGAGWGAWVTGDLLNDSHWWLGDGIQREFYFTLFAGIFALLSQERGHGRGVFFRPARDDQALGRRVDRAERRDQWLMAALAGALFVGTWGYYDGLWLPVPFVVTLVLLGGWGLTSRLSELDCAEGAAAGLQADESWLVENRGRLLSEARRQAGQAARRHRARGASRRHRRPARPAGDFDPGVTALKVGPEGTWWENGVAALTVGCYWSMIPIGFDVYEWWTNGNLDALGFPFGLQDVVGDVASIAISYLAGLFLFGALVPYLRGGRTPVKGLFFGLIAFAADAADAGLDHLLDINPYSYFVTDGLLAVALFAVTGLLLDLRTLRDHSGQGLIDRIYQLGGVRVAVTSVTTVVVVGVSLWQAVYLTDQSEQQRLSNLSTAATYTNGVAGTGAPVGPGK